LGITESLLHNKPHGQLILRDVLQPISDGYDLVIFDCPPFLGMLVLNALCASNLLIIPTQPEIFSIHALRNLMKWVNQVRLSHNPGLAYRLLLTMVDLRNRTHRMLCEELNRTFKQGLFETVINIDTKLRESPIAGVPVLTHSPNCRAAVQYRSVAQDILNYVKTKTKTPN
jgi:chromosome partitioning protein